MRRPRVPLLLILCAALVGGPSLLPAQATGPARPCVARATTVSDTPIEWHRGPAEDADELERWCRGVGAPVIDTIPVEVEGPLPSLDQVVVVSWNVHLSEGRLETLVADLRRGRWTQGTPVTHFVLLLQELYRRGSAVPAFDLHHARSAFAIRTREHEAPDVQAYARSLGLAVAYVPSMRNGAELNEDRGNAIVSTEPLHDLFALELPLERQRRVASGASILLKTEAGPAPLQLLTAHLEPLASPSALWIFRNPRRRQMAALLSHLDQPRFRDAAGTVIGGDFNTIQGGARERAYQQARAWARSTGREDRRRTHAMGRLDYVFARLAPGWQSDTIRLDERYGSDHYPVLARFEPPDRTSR